MGRWITEYEDAGKPYVSEIQADSLREAEAYAIHRGLGERVLPPAEAAPRAASSPRPSSQLEAFLQVPSVAAGLAAIRAVNALAHLATRANLRLDARGMLGYSGPLQLAVDLVAQTLEVRDNTQDEPTEFEKLRDQVLTQVRHLEAQVPGLPL